jgi:hypothetical protein
LEACTVESRSDQCLSVFKCEDESKEKRCFKVKPCEVEKLEKSVSDPCPVSSSFLSVHFMFAHLYAVQRSLFTRCDGVNAEDLLLSQIERLAKGMRKELTRDCELPLCEYDLAAGSSLKIRDEAKFKVDASNKAVR